MDGQTDGQKDDGWMDYGEKMWGEVAGGRVLKKK